MTDSTTRTDADPAAIEQDIRRTQDEMSRTVDKLGDQLTPKNLFNALLEKADEKGVDSQYLFEGARNNPMALGLIAAGTIWLLSDKNSKFPTLKGKSTKDDEYDPSDVHHRDYVSHMSALDMRDGEDPLAYQRRRDLHRANFLMCERKPDEDEGAFRERLDQLTESFRDKRRAWSDSISQAGSSGAQSVKDAGAGAQRTARQAATKAQNLYGQNPLVGGILAAAVGAALGSTVPISRKEQETLGDLGTDARNLVSEQKDKLTDLAMEKKDELLDKADEKLEQTASASPKPGQSAGSDKPFILPEPTR
ncbi:DUF3618 domain-containing protein [Sphingomonas mesophila]|uniref:DUF3618 domain-containing protein n=1 Tax=Sphingomonas mesophila TaxID=2303576 RepID=UPI000E568B66|nr:DUF3618 domain-containing protein [Sphingomonas mesophila]